MTSLKINYFMEVLMVIFFVFVAITSILMNRGGRLFNLDTYKIHHIIGIALLVLIAIHIILHFKFITAMTKNLFKRNSENPEQQ